MYYSECMALNAEIERLKAENDKIDKESTAYASIIQKQDKEIEDLRLQNIELQKRNEKLFSDYCKEQKRLEKQCISTVEQAKIKAVKEFAEELKRKAFNKDMFNDWAGATYVVLVREIDELLKEYEQ